MNKIDSMAAWKKACTKIGRPTNLIAIVTSFLPVLYLCIRYDCWPDMRTLLSAWGMTVAAFGAFYIVEPISYYAALGASGTYMSFLSGNISNIRMPVASIALDQTKSEPGTVQAEVVSTMAICGSILTNLAGVTLAASIGNAIVSLLPEVVATGLKSYAATAVFGAVLGSFVVKDPKLGLCGVAAAIVFMILKWYVAIPIWLIIIMEVFGTVGIARLMYVSKRASGTGKESGDGQ